MPGTTSFTARAAIASLAAPILLAGIGPAHAKKGKSKWPIDMGEVIRIDSAAQIVDIKNADGRTVSFKVTPQTEMEKERERPVKFVRSAEFSDLKEGQWVRIKYYGGDSPKIARDIDIFPQKPIR